MRAKETKITRGQHGLARQRGVAVVTALLLTTLSVTLVSSLFWQQQVQVRSIENQQLQLQKQWILRGALDWAKLILLEDAAVSSVDHLGESWAAPLAASGLGSHLGKGGASIKDALLSGKIVDAQSRFNLRNLAPDGTIDLREVAALRRLLTALQLNPQLAQRAAELIKSAYIPPAVESDDSAAAKAGAAAKTGARMMNVVWTDDLLAIAGMTPEALGKLKDFVVVLEHPTPVNINTASLQVLTAKMDTLAAEEVAALVAGRDRAYIRDGGDLTLRLQGKSAETFEKDISFSTNYFLVDASVRMDKGSLQMQALMARNIMTGSKLVWVRDY